MATKTEKGFGLVNIADFLFSLCGEKVPKEGEDGYAYALNESRGLLAVFDGAGDEPFPTLQKKSGGYLASRAAAGTYLRWFEGLEAGQESDAKEVETLVRRSLALCREYGGEGRKKLATTAAAAICQPGRGGVDVHLHWTGNSRVYLLDGEGLGQLTEDDPGGVDAMAALTREEAPSVPETFRLHTGRLTMGRPGLLFAATDGCFGGFSTPMEFEYVLLSTLQAAQNAMAWEESLNQAIGKAAQDDYSLCGMALNAGSFEDLKRQLARRTSLVYHTYIRGLESCSDEEKQQLWEHYRDHYHRLLCPV